MHAYINARTCHTCMRAAIKTLSSTTCCCPIHPFSEVPTSAVCCHLQRYACGSHHRQEHAHARMHIHTHKLTQIWTRTNACENTHMCTPHARTCTRKRVSDSTTPYMHVLVCLHVSLRSYTRKPLDAPIENDATVQLMMESTVLAT